MNIGVEHLTEAYAYHISSTSVANTGLVSRLTHNIMDNKYMYYMYLQNAIFKISWVNVDFRSY